MVFASLDKFIAYYITEKTEAQYSFGANVFRFFSSCSQKSLNFLDSYAKIGCQFMLKY